MKPWICPRCDTIWAPWVPRCTTCAPSAVTATIRTVPGPDLMQHIRMPHRDGGDLCPMWYIPTVCVANPYGAMVKDGDTLCLHEEGQPPS